MRLHDALSECDHLRCGRLAVRWATRAPNAALDGHLLDCAQQLLDGTDRAVAALEELRAATATSSGRHTPWYLACRLVADIFGGWTETAARRAAVVAQRAGVSDGLAWADLLDELGETDRDVAAIAAGLAPGWEGALSGLVTAARALDRHEP